MVPMNMNLVGGAAAVVALLAVFSLSNCGGNDSAPAPIPEVEAPAEPAPAPPDVQKPKPKPAPTTKTPVKKPAKPNPNSTIYHRVEQGGKRGDAVGCSSVKPFAEGKSQAELAALAKQYKVTVENLNRYFVCTP